MAHNDFAVLPDSDIDPQKTNKYMSFLKNESPLIEIFTSVCKEINTLQYTEFAQLFYTEFKSLNQRRKQPLEKAWEKNFTHLTSKEGVFQFHFQKANVVLHAEKVKLELAKRNVPWECEILDADKKKKAEAAALISFLKGKIHEMLESKCNENTEMSVHDFRGQIQSIIKEAKETFSLKSNKEIMSIAKLNKTACSGGLSILNWCGLDYSKSKRTADDDKETLFLKITNLHSSEEE